MQRFAIRILVFLLPFALVLGLPVSVLLLSGELTSVSEVIASQEAGEDVLFGPAYSNVTTYYKLQSTLRRKPAILALGTSRVMQFRAYFFRNTGDFYNAGGGVDRLEDFKLFLGKLDYSPETLIVGLDQYFFNDSWQGFLNSDYVENASSENSNALGTITQNWMKVYRDYSARKFTLSELVQRRSGRRVGLSAVAKRAGFRIDGSYDYGEAHSDQEASTRFDEAFERIERGNQRFQTGQRVSDRALRELEVLLERCASKNIRVVGFLPPYAHAVWEAMMSRGDDYQYMREIFLRVKPLFDRHGFAFFDFSDLATLGVSDEEAVDGFHGSEASYLRIFLQMAHGDESLSFLSADEGYLLTDKSRLLAADASENHRGYRVVPTEPRHDEIISSVIGPGGPSRSRAYGK